MAAPEQEETEWRAPRAAIRFPSGQWRLIATLAAVAALLLLFLLHG